ncbi:MFS transporter [uncultured Sutterella sp.]|uniref:MFS transporter n=1 Tax=uncultured Sutterella sp. TaxID=286133 RepID=UPI0025EBA2AA|nr:MFS transporter [uncultured Sutterella sp.]
MIAKHVLALSLGTLALGIAEFSMMSILLPTAGDLGVSVPEAGHFIAAYAAGVCAGVVLMTLFGRSVPLKRLLLILCAVIVLGNAVTVFAPNYGFMIASRFISGLPHGAFFGVGSIVCAELSRPGETSRDVCLMVAGMTIANLAGVPLASFLAWAVSWRAAFVIAAGAGLATLLAVKCWVPALPALPNKGFAAQFRFLGAFEPWLVLFAIGLGNGGFFAYYSYVNPVIEHVAGIPASLMWVVITLAGAGMVGGSLFCAKIAPNYSNPALAAFGQGVLFIALVALFFLAHWAPAAVFLTTLVAACAFFVSGPQQVMMIENAKEGRILAAALCQCSFNAGNALGAWLGGLPIAAGKSAEWSAMPGIFLALAGFGLLFAKWMIHTTRTRERLEGRIAALKDQVEDQKAELGRR